MSKLFLSQEQIGRMLDLAKDNPRNCCLFHLQLSTGLRIGDTLRLKRKQLIDSDSLVVRSIRLKMGKTGQWVARKLREDCRAVVASYLKTRSDDNPYLFPSLSNNSRARRGPMSRVAAHGVYKRYLSLLFPKSILSGASTHTMRRSVAKMISVKAGRIEPATTFLGHASVSSTMSYIDMGDQERRADEIVLGELHW